MKNLQTTRYLPAAEKALLGRCRQVIESIDPTAEVILYGSRARGDARSDSDYDLLVLTDGPANLRAEDALRRQLYPIELETGAVLTVILTRRKDWHSPLYAAMPLYQNIRRDGIRL